MATYAKGTRVPVERSKQEAEHVLQRFGAKRTMTYQDDTVWVMAFEAGTRRFKLAFPRPERPWGTSNAAYAQAERERWRAIILYLRATLAAVEAGFITLEDAFLAHTLLPSGETVGEWIDEQLEEVQRSRQMPPMLPWAGGRSG